MTRRWRDHPPLLFLLRTVPPPFLSHARSSHILSTLFLLQTTLPTTMPAARTPKTSTRLTPTPVKCKECGRQISRKGDMPRHLQVHDPARGPWLCPVEGCKRRFRQKSNGQSHIVVHFGKRPHRCDQQWIDENEIIRDCVARFADPSGLTRHRTNKHGYKRNEGEVQTIQYRHSRDQAEQKVIYDLLTTYKATVNDVRALINKLSVNDTPIPWSLVDNSDYCNILQPIWSPLKQEDSASTPALTPTPTPTPAPTPTSTSSDVLPKQERSPSASLASIPLDLDSQQPNGRLDFDFSFEAYDMLGGSSNTSQQPQQRTFVDVLGQSDLILPSQVPSQFFSVPLPSQVPSFFGSAPLTAPAPFSFAAPPQLQPAMDRGRSAWQYTLSNVSLEPSLDASLCYGSGIYNTLDVNFASDMGLHLNTGLNTGLDTGHHMNSGVHMNLGLNMGLGLDTGIGLGLDMSTPAVVGCEAPQFPPFDSLFCQAAAAFSPPLSPSVCSSIESSPSSSNGLGLKDHMLYRA
uniref:C2H2-type domain-containing protein n=1 Tax=Trametes gibbosa TaxID=160864 RepID=A0A6G6FQB5_9APHY|nr:hypothetical protein [Trametes gibbosa]